MGGINSKITTIKTDNGETIILKHYKNDDPSRMKREVAFLKLLRKMGVKNVPQLIENNEKDGWSKITYIEGKEVENINKESAEAIVEFIKEINTKEGPIQDLELAQDAYTSGLVVEQDIRRRLKRYKEIKSNKVSKEFGLWVERNLFVWRLK